MHKLRPTTTLLVAQWEVVVKKVSSAAQPVGTLFQEHSADISESVARYLVLTDRSKWFSQSWWSAAHWKHVEWRLHAANLDPWPFHRRSQELWRGLKGGSRDQIVQRMYSEGQLLASYQA